LAGFGVDTGNVTDFKPSREIALVGKAAFPGVTRTSTLLEREGISFRQVQRALMASVAKSINISVPMDIAIMDASGNLKGLYRMDRSNMASMDVATKKANTAIRFGRGSEVLGPASLPGQQLWRVESTNEGLITFAGGWPIIDANNNLIGSIGCSSGTAQQDQTVCGAGRDAALVDADVPNVIPATLLGDQCRTSLEYAHNVLHAAHQAANNISVAFTFTVVDAEGRMKALWRMDGANIGSLRVSQTKAFGAAFMGGPSDRLTNRTLPGGGLFSYEISNGGLVSFGGGVPFLRGGAIAGTIGVSGGFVDQDKFVAGAAMLAANTSTCGPVTPDAPATGVAVWLTVVIAVAAALVGGLVVYFVTRVRDSESTRPLLSSAGH